MEVQLLIFLFFGLSPLLSLGLDIPKSNSKEENIKRAGKVFSLFSIVNFQNGACQSTSATSGTTGAAFRNGTCFTSNECSNKGGLSAGNCASGFGVCCVFISSDPSVQIRQNCSYIQNPGFPTALTTTTALSYTIAKTSPGVCDLRLDFGTFTIAGPTGSSEAAATTTSPGGGFCATDTFTITTTTSQRIPVICGQNSGQHVYIDVGSQASDTATLAFAFTGASSVRTWDIKVTQIPCSASYAEPPGCLQYVTGVTGRFTTFNFLDQTTSHLANQQYTICIRQEAGFCCIQYQLCTDPNSFTIDSQQALPGTSLIDTQCIAGTTNSGDYISIIGSSNTCETTPGQNLVEKYCGRFFNSLSGQGSATVIANVPVCDCSAPFEVGIYTDSVQDTNAIAESNRGVCLTYTQIPC